MRCWSTARQGVGQFELALALAQALAVRGRRPAARDGPAGSCASCQLRRGALASRPAGARARGAARGARLGPRRERGGRRAPGRQDASRARRSASRRCAPRSPSRTTTSARGRGKVVVVHPAERMNAVAANALAEDARGAAPATRASCSARPRPTPCCRRSAAAARRSSCRCRRRPTPRRWLRRAGRRRARRAARRQRRPAAGGAGAGAESGIDAAAWRALPARVAARRRGGAARLAAAARRRCAAEALPRRDGAACGARAALLPGGRARRAGDSAPLLRLARELARVARDAEHPWNADAGASRAWSSRAAKR